MIVIHRGREPGNLKRIRQEELDRVRPLAMAETLTSKDFGDRYKEVRNVTRNDQFNKCCYCEKPYQDAAYNDVEHFRPKAYALRGPGHPNHGYWWLAWTWNNLLFACNYCNRSAKGGQFPLGAGSTALNPEEVAPLNETPLLIDPCRVNPLHHIKYELKSLEPGQDPRWAPWPRRGSRIGAITIDVLMLRREDLLDYYRDHFNHYLDRVVRRLKNAIGMSTKDQIREIWNEDVLSFIKPDRPFTGLSYDVFDHYFPRVVRNQWKLPLRQPRRSTS